MEGQAQEAASASKRRSRKPLVKAAAETFVRDEVNLIDERRFEDWLALFAEDGYYWVPTRVGQLNPYEELSLFYDTRELLQTRIERLRHPAVHVQTPPSRTVHILSDIRVGDPAAGSDEFLVGSKFLMLEYRQGEQRLFGGRNTYCLRRTGDGLRIAWKKVELINCDASFAPIAVLI